MSCVQHNVFYMKCAEKDNGVEYCRKSHRFIVVNPYNPEHINSSTRTAEYNDCHRPK